MQLLLARCGIVLLAVCLVNCSAWKATQVPLSELEGKKIRITTREGEKQQGELVNADSLGFAVMQCSFARPSVLSFDSSSIALVEKRAYNSSRTFAMVMLPVALVLGFVGFAHSVLTPPE